MQLLAQDSKVKAQTDLPDMLGAKREFGLGDLHVEMLYWPSPDSWKWSA